MDHVEAIKDRLPIYELVSQYVELKKAGRNYKGLCPFHSEKTPSFVVSPEKGLAYCFGCNQGGDVFAFYQGVEGCDFPEAIRALADRTGVEIKQRVSSKVLKERKSQKETLQNLHQLAVEHYQRQLWQSESGKQVLQYLYSRGLDEEIIKRFNLGYSPESRLNFCQIALKDGHEQTDLVASGLVNSSDTTASDVYDRFRQRLMIPITDQKGNFVAFGGRALAKDLQPKYLNSPDTPIYHKSKILYGFADAKEAMRKQDQVYMTEGYFDVFAFAQAGISNAVATCGTALTEQQVALLKRFVDKIVFAFDADNAGREALLRGAEIALRAGLSVNVLLWDGGKDPADLIKDDVSKLQEVVETAEVDLLEFIWRTEFADKSQIELQNPEFVSVVMAKYLPLLQAVDSAVKKDLFIRRLAQFLRTQPRFIYDELDEAKRNKRVYRPSSKQKLRQDPKAENFEQNVTVEEFFWSYLSFDLSLLDDLIEQMQKWDSVFTIKEVYKQVLDFYNSGRCLNDFVLTDLDLEQQTIERFNHIGLYLETKGIDRWSKPQLLKEIKLLFNRLVINYREHRLGELKQSIAEAERLGDRAHLQDLLKQYNDFLQST